jgi:hypothetical protein
MAAPEPMLRSLIDTWAVCAFSTSACASSRETVGISAAKLLRSHEIHGQVPIG